MIDSFVKTLRRSKWNKRTHALIHHMALVPSICTGYGNELTFCTAGNPSNGVFTRQS